MSVVPDFLIWHCVNCGKAAVGTKKPCGCTTDVGYREGPNGTLEHVQWDKEQIGLSKEYIDQAIAHREEGGKFDNGNARDFLTEIERLRARLRDAEAQAAGMRTALEGINTFAWSALTADCSEAHQEITRRVQQCRDALASTTIGPEPTSPEPVRDELDQEGLEIAASAILDSVPIGYGMTRPEAIDYARAAILAYREWEREHWTIATEHLVARLPVLGQCEALLRCYPAQLPRCTSKAAFRRDGHIVCGSHMRTASNLYTEPKAPDDA